MEATTATEGMRVSVLVVEDHAFFRRGLRLTLERRGFLVAAEAASAEEALELVSRVRPDVVVMDLHLPGMSGVEAAARLSAVPAAPAVLMLTVSTSSADLHRALAAGAAGYVLKDGSGDDLERAIRAVAAGRAWVSEEMTTALVERVRALGGLDEAGDAMLTPRELEVLRILARGEGNAAIAARLGISEHTVKTHVAAILEKLGVSNRVQAATLAVQRGLI